MPTKIDKAVKVVAVIAVIGSLTPFVLAAIYGIAFYSKAPSLDRSAAWGQFGDFLGGTSNPLIAVLSLSVLVITLLQQARQLADSRSELAESRVLLSQSQTALASVANELNEQSRHNALAVRLNTTNILIAQYSVEIRHLQELPLVASDPRFTRLEEVIERRVKLQLLLDNMYANLT